MPKGRQTVLQQLQQLKNEELLQLCWEYGLVVAQVSFINRRHVERRLTVAVIGDRARARVREQIAREREEQYSQNPSGRSSVYREMQAWRPSPPRWIRSSTMTTPSVRLLRPSAIPVPPRRSGAPPLFRRRFQRQQGPSILDRALSSVQEANFFGYQVPSLLWRYASRGLGYTPPRPARFRGGQGEETVDLSQEQENQYQLEVEHRYSEESQDQYESQYQILYEERYEDDDQMQSRNQYEEDQQNEEQYHEYGNQNEFEDEMPYTGEPSSYGATRYYSHENHETVSMAEQSEDQRLLELQLHCTYGEDRPQVSLNSPLPYNFQELAQLNLMDRQDRQDRIDHQDPMPQTALRNNQQPDAESDPGEYLSCISSTSSFHDAIAQPVGIVRALPMKKRFDWFGWMKTIMAPRPKGQNERIAKRDQTREYNLESERELVTIDYLKDVDSKAELETPLLELMSRHELRHSSEEDEDSIGSSTDLQPGFFRQIFELLFCDPQGSLDIKKVNRSLFCCGASLFLYVSFKLMP
ncbi:uncharacterized protein LOC108164263 [Drosophila miranda]|uniref:uncharacterized protein LOC108164263 n=1 Tax=Drosophila miranda TaxID=7229 RepID=UPI0007E83174|nr:uncharacterized protein LOC108164263 [Drosophila miranda]